MDNLSSIQQNSFYEYITFVASSMLFSLLVFGGLSTIELAEKEFNPIVDISKQSPSILIFGTLIFLLIAHIYGQLISVLSEKFIGKPLKLINKYILKNPDFKGSFSGLISKIDQGNCLPEVKKNNKWSLIYFIIWKSPDVGKDLMKRYAREKVSRINSMNFLILLIISLLIYFFRESDPNQKLIFQYWQTNVALLVFLMIFTFEYYQRKIWNHDLIVKTAIIFIESK